MQSSSMHFACRPYNPVIPIQLLQLSNYALCVVLAVVVYDHNFIVNVTASAICHIYEATKYNGWIVCMLPAANLLVKVFTSSHTTMAMLSLSLYVGKSTEYLSFDGMF